MTTVLIKSCILDIEKAQIAIIFFHLVKYTKEIVQPHKVKQTDTQNENI